MDYEVLYVDCLPLYRLGYPSRSTIHMKKLNAFILLTIPFRAIAATVAFIFIGTMVLLFSIFNPTAEDLPTASELAANWWKYTVYGISP